MDGREMQEGHKRKVAEILRRIADDIDCYLPDEVMLRGSRFSVTIGDNYHTTIDADCKMSVDRRRS